MKRVLLLLTMVAAAVATWTPAREPHDRTTAGYLAAPSGSSVDFAGVKVLFEKEGLYHYIRVIQSGKIRRLQFRRSGTDYEESAINVANPLEFELHYYELMLAGFAHQPDPKAILFIGLGGGTLPMAMRRYFPQARIDAVELDPDVVLVAKKYFGLKEDDHMKVYVRDGRRQVRQFLREKKQYDVIFLDAFRGGYIPYHLTTKEFLESLKKLLTPDGIVVSNLQSGFASYHYQRRTMAAVFPNQWSYGSVGNVIVVTGMGSNPPAKSDLVAAAEQLQKQKRFTVDLPAIVKAGGMRNDYDRQGRILTDDYAPTDVLRGIPRD